MMEIERRDLPLGYFKEVERSDPQRLDRFTCASIENQTIL